MYNSRHDFALTIVGDCQYAIRMNIILNGEQREIPDASTAAALVDLLDLGERRIAMEVNLEIVPRGAYADHILQEGDRVEIVHAIGGG